MLAMVRTTVVFLVLMTILTGLVYPGLVTVIAQVALPDQANGSLVAINGKAVGSRLVGQSFTAPKYLWGRLSATSPTPYNAAASSGSNFGPLHPDLVKNARTRIDSLRQGGLTKGAPVPVDLVTASGSGLDPHISPAAAELQVGRIAAARGKTEAEIREIVQLHTEARQLGILGEPRVNVLLVNLALDGSKP